MDERARKLNSIDSELRACTEKITLLRTEMPGTNMYNMLFKRLKLVPKHKYVKTIEVLNDACKSFFGDGGNFGNETNAGQVNIWIKENAFGEFSGYSKCDIDPYYVHPVQTGSKEAPSVRNAALSFRMGNIWKNLYFVSTHDLILLMCKHFLPENEDRDWLLASLTTHYEDIIKRAQLAQEEKNKQNELEVARVERAFVSAVLKLPEFASFKSAVDALRETPQFSAAILPFNSVYLTKKAFDV